LDDCGSAAYIRYRWDSKDKECINAILSFSSTLTIVSTPREWVIPITHRIHLIIKGFGNSEGGNNKAIRWSLCIEDIDSSNSSIFELIHTQDGSARKEDRCSSPVGNLVFDETRYSYAVPTVISYISF